MQQGPSKESSNGEFPGRKAESLLCHLKQEGIDPGKHQAASHSTKIQPMGRERDQHSGTMRIRPEGCTRGHDGKWAKQGESGV